MFGVLVDPLSARGDNIALCRHWTPYICKLYTEFSFSLSHHLSLFRLKWSDLHELLGVFVIVNVYVRTPLVQTSCVWCTERTEIERQTHIQIYTQIHGHAVSVLCCERSTVQSSKCVRVCEYKHCVMRESCLNLSVKQKNIQPRNDDVPLSLWMRTCERSFFFDRSKRIECIACGVVVGI